MMSNDALLSEMSGFRLTKAARLEAMKNLIPAGKSRVEMARICGVTDRTIRRDFETWLAAGEFEAWLIEEFLQLHFQIRATNPEAAYRGIALIVAKMLKQKIEAEFTGSAPIIVQMYDPLQDPARKDAKAAEGSNPAPGIEEDLRS
jgi:hypothetical protein